MTAVIPRTWGNKREPVRVAQMGLGPIGVESLKLAAAKPWIQIVGGIDIDPAKTGRRLADVVGAANFADARVYSSFDALCEFGKPDVVLHTAGSAVRQAIEQIKPIVSAGVSVASTCEELLYPALRAPDAARELDEACRAGGAAVVATGVNPGFVLDVLPVTLTGVCRAVRGIYGERVVDASTRRGPLQKKIGSGLPPEEFRALFRAGKAGHAGFRESAALVAHALGWEIERLEETCDPVFADHDIKTAFFEVRRGLTRGLHQHVSATMKGGQILELDLKMYLDAADPHDAVRIDGDPPMDVRINGGTAGDHATVAALINAVPRLLRAEPGLRLMTDIAVPAYA